MTVAWVMLAATTPAAVPDTAAVLVRVVGALVVVLAVVWGGARWLRRSVRGGASVRPRLQVLEGRSLGQRQMLWVVGYDRQRWLVASSPSGVSLVAALPPAEPGEAETAATVGFAETLQRVLTRAS